jgi:hypothetical protein
MSLTDLRIANNTNYDNTNDNITPKLNDTFPLLKNINRKNKIEYKNNDNINNNSKKSNLNNAKLPNTYNVVDIINNTEKRRAHSANPYKQNFNNLEKNKYNIINGLSIIKKKNFFIIKIWISNKKYNNLKYINLTNSIYKKYISNIKFTNFL